MGVNLSIIILSYNTKDLTEKCLLTLLKNLNKNKNLTVEIIVLDNASTDGSVQMLKRVERENKDVKVILNDKNLGFAKGNNKALKTATGRYVLYLNSDVLLKKIDFVELVEYLKNNSKVGGLTVKMLLSENEIDPASHRGFPTLSSSLFYFLSLEYLTKSIPLLNRIFGGYHLTHLNLNEIHEIDSPSGAFFMVKTEILKKIGGFDEDFFFYGEDLDLAFRIKERGYKIVYYPKFEVFHLKHGSSGLALRFHFYDAMRIFYKKHYEEHNSKLINKFVYLLFSILKYRYVKNRN